MTERISLLVLAVIFGMVLNPKVSSSVSHCIPRARSNGKSSKSRLRFFTDGARSSLATEDKISRRLLIHFVKRKPPLLNNSGSCSTNRTASSVVATDLTQSST